MAAVMSSPTSASSIIAKFRKLKSEIQDQHSISIASQPQAATASDPLQLPEIRSLPAWKQFQAQLEQDRQTQTLGEGQRRQTQQNLDSSTNPSVFAQSREKVIDGGQTEYHEEDYQDRYERSRILGPNYIVSEDSVRNDYSQRFVDSGIGELPGNGVRNPSFDNRFEEYPRLQKLVRLKDIQIIKQRRTPTYLQADLKQSLMPLHEFSSVFSDITKKRNLPNQEGSTPESPVTQCLQSETVNNEGRGRETDSSYVEPTEPSKEQKDLDPENYESMIASSSTITSSPGRTTQDHHSLLPSSSQDSTSTSVSTSTSIASTPNNREQESLESSSLVLDRASDERHRRTDVSTKRPFHLLQLLPVKFDVIVIDPPLEAYEWEEPPNGSGECDKSWSWREISELPVPSIAAKESFIFLWVGTGSGDGLERGREILTKWGYRRCEDIVWVRTNSDSNEVEKEQPATNSALSRSAQHCLMGIKGTVRRSDDANFVHCNIDTDVILWDGEKTDSNFTNGTKNSDFEQKPTTQRIDARAKPPELYNIAENFCLGTRRLELFGRNRNLRRGWLTIGADVGPDSSGWRGGEAPLEDIKAVEKGRGPILEEGKSQKGLSHNQPEERLDSEFQALKPIEYSKEEFNSNFTVDHHQVDLRSRGNLMPFDEEIDALRPRTPGKEHFARRGNFSRGSARDQGQNHSARDFNVVADGPSLPKGLGYSRMMNERAKEISDIDSIHIASDQFHQSKRQHEEMQAKIQAQMNHFYQNQRAIPSFQPHPQTQGIAYPSFPPPGQSQIQPYPPAQQPQFNPSQVARPGGSGLGAGGPRIVSVPSGSDTLSGPQRVVLAQQQWRGGGGGGRGRSSSRGSGR